MHLLLTRPQPDADRTADMLRGRGHAVTVAPVLQVETMPDAGFGPGPYAALVMTSANAARVIAGHRRRDELLGLPVFTVGRRTAEAVRAAGFATVVSADGGVPELVRLIASKLRGGGILYFGAQERAGDLAGALATHGIVVDTVVVYRAAPNPDFDLRAALNLGIDSVVHYSRRSAQTFLLAAGTAGLIDAALRLTHYCFSSEVAAPLRAAGAASVKVAPRPDEAALIGLIG
jgi:uroporphyrinogen-III synthase